MKKNWVKSYSILILVVLVVALSGCSCAKGKGTTAETVTAPPAVVETVPSEDVMAAELAALGDLLNTNSAINSLNSLVAPGGTPTYVNLSAVYSTGVVAYLYSATTNVYPAVNISGLPIPVGSLKVVQILNTDDCVPQAFQVKPTVSFNPANYENQSAPAPVWVTEAMVAERSGCAGVSNTGFVILAIEADITAFQFNTCPTLNCANN